MASNGMVTEVYAKGTQKIKRQITFWLVKQVLEMEDHRVSYRVSKLAQKQDANAA